MNIYNKIYKQRAKFIEEVHKEHNDCSVIAVAIACRTDYSTAHKALLIHGRHCRDGAYTATTLAAIKSLGCVVDKVLWLPKQPKTGYSYTGKTIGKLCNTGYWLISYDRHLAACYNGIVQDWTHLRNNRVVQVYKIIKPRGK